ncbi:FkbM family methyltransferase [Leeia oryzae]|uniref:FkbM family methyltransferase n=1 Tax=Leeia oryzae TaxID=356662 RepID=UPI00036C5CDD|nr:FkbM family methyltransferase [Leeia oryzae]
MKSLHSTRHEFQHGLIDKPTFIRTMYEEHHYALYDYASYIGQTNIRKIEIEDNQVIMTTKDRGIRLLCSAKDYRIAPIEILNFLDYEKDEYSMIDNLSAECRSIIDIGANIGLYALNMAVSNRSAKIFCFEPIPKTFSVLQENIRLNSVNNIHAFNFGLSDENNEFLFYYYPEGSGNASSVNVSERSDIETVTCQVKKMDTYFATEGIHADFIKCDVEGAELLVFKGGQTVISRDCPIVFSEILRKWSAKFNYNPNEIFTFFANLGYRAFTAKNNYLHAFSVMDEKTVETNFFFLHNENHKELIKRYEYMTA